MLRSVGSKVASVGGTAFKVHGRALNFRAAFLAIVVLALSYGMVLLAVVNAYRKGYGIVGSPNSRSGSRQRDLLVSRRSATYCGPYSLFEEETQPGETSR